MACPSPELLAALAEGRLSPADRDAVLDHGAACDDCRQTLLILDGLNPGAARQPVGHASRGWIPWAVAAAIFTVSVLAVFLRGEDPKPQAAVHAPPRKEGPRPESPRPDAATPPVAPEPPKPNVPNSSREEPAAPKTVPVPAPAPVPVVPVVPAPEKPEPPAPAPPSPAPEPSRPTTSVVVAVLNRFDGDVSVLNGTQRTPAKAGQELRQGEGLDCRGPRSWAVFSYPDKTRVEVEGDTLVRELLPREPGKGLRVILDKGAARAEVSKQPAGQPLILETPYGEAKVVGTTLRVAVEGRSLRLDVEEGKVELRNAAGKTVLVDAGHFAVAAAGAAPAAKRFPKEQFLLAYDFEDGKKPAAFSKGTVVQGPDRRICLALETDAEGGSRLTIGDEDGVFTATGEETLSFDYWADPQASSINVNLWNRTAKQAVDGALPKVTTGKWAHATLSLGDIGDVRIKEGDWIASLLLQATGGGPRKFYIDNLVLSRPRSLRPRTPDSK